MEMDTFFGRRSGNAGGDGGKSSAGLTFITGSDHSKRPIGPRPAFLTEHRQFPPGAGELVPVPTNADVDQEQLWPFLGTTAYLDQNS
jgi:hypothetical protein